MQMISFNNALQTVFNQIKTTTLELVGLHEASGRILAEDIFSDTDFPPFDKAAMDGFALKSTDLDKTLKIVETIAAGHSPKHPIHEGEAAKIMTGAEIPEGVDIVVEVELTQQTGNTVMITGKTKCNIIFKGEHLKKGDKVLTKGTCLDARHIAVLAATGIVSVPVYKKIKVGIISTGSEIVEPEIIPGISQIRNSNGHQLIEQVLSCQAIPVYYGIVPDHFEYTKMSIVKGLNECDMLLLTGGVSMGDFDFVPQILEELNVEILFKHIAVKPGKPTTFGTFGPKLIFGLPGNPVSAFMQFETLVKPAIFKSMGNHFEPISASLKLAESFTVKKTGSVNHIPVSIINNEIYFSNYKGSSHLHALTNSSGYIVLSEIQDSLTKGDYADVRLF